jgi:hypothetical protein
MNKFDHEQRNFTEEEDEQALWTPVFYDSDVQVCAIARKTTLTPKVDSIARQLKKALSNSAEARKNNVSIVVSPILDPQGFIFYLRDSYQIKNFEITLSRPNPWDVEGDFHKPNERLLEAANGKRGKVQIAGDALDKKVCEDLAHSAASAGEDASARLLQSANAHPVKRTLGDKGVVLQADAVTLTEQRREFVAELRRAYDRVRHPADDE